MLTVKVFGMETQDRAKREARRLLLEVANNRGVALERRIDYDAKEMMRFWWNCEASAEIIE